uniref:Uncharacterized protein n=1 Tax=Plectus sambesii TaxID=2011161 RepID=A0A914XMX4_9BILA
MQARGYPSSVWLDDFSIFASRADYGYYYDYSTSDNIFITYELRFCYNSCSMLSTLSFGWTETMMDGMIVTDNPYYFPPGSDATNYYFKVENFDYMGYLHPPNYYSGDSNYNRRVLTFFDNVLSLDVYSRALTFDDHFAKIFESNTAGSCGLVTQDVADTTDDFVYPLQGGISATNGNPDDFFINNCRDLTT